MALPFWCSLSLMTLPSEAPALPPPKKKRTFPNRECLKLNFVPNIGFHIHRHKYGQTSCAVVRAEIQKRCNVKASSCTYDLFLFNWFFNCIYAHFLGWWYCHLCSHRLYNSFRSRFNILLREDLFNAATASISSTGCLSRTAERRRDCTEHCTIQENNFYHSMGAAGAICLLCSSY